MKIIRDGVEIELTFEERLEAYHEQQHIYDIQNIKENLSWIMDHFGVTRDRMLIKKFSKEKDFFERAAEVSRYLQDNDDVAYTDSLVEGVRRALEDRREENGK